MRRPNIPGGAQRADAENAARRAGGAVDDAKRLAGAAAGVARRGGGGGGGGGGAAARARGRVPRSSGGAESGTSGAAGPTKRPYGRFRFMVEIDGLAVAHFQSVTGLSHEIEVLSQQEGGVNDRQHKLPGQGSYPNLVLKLGFVNSPMLEDWHRSFSTGASKVGRKNGSVVLLDDDGSELARWNFTRAWPVKWEGPELDASATQILVESVEIAHEGIHKG